MKKRNKWVIDADIAQSSGKTEHPVSKSCRIFLNFIRDKGYFIVMNKELINEWNQHKSYYAKKWLASMHARKKIIKNSDDLSFEQKIIISPNLTEKQKKAALKDIHLLNASKNHGKTIASGDDAARKIYVVLAVSHHEISNILWINPKTNSNEIIDYVKNVKKAKNEWFLNK